MADFVGWLPPGCALWRSTGGPLAWSDDVRLLHEVEYRLRVLAWQQTKDAKSGRNQPKPPEEPKFTGEARTEQAHAERQAAARRKRHGR
jgi:hypothetical protein